MDAAVGLEVVNGGGISTATPAAHFSVGLLISHFPDDPVQRPLKAPSVELDQLQVGGLFEEQAGHHSRRRFVREMDKPIGASGCQGPTNQQ